MSDESRHAPKLIVVGGGQSAAQLIEAARRGGFAGDIRMVSEETVPPYQRPPLSKQYLTGSHVPAWLAYRSPEFYAEHRVEVTLGRTVVQIDRARGTVMLDDGECVAYDRLALTTGARARRLEVPGSPAAAIFYLRTLADTVLLQQRLVDARRIIIVGGGFIGLETAATLVQKGFDVTVLGQHEQLLPRVVSREISEFLSRIHVSRGVKLEFKKSVVEVRAGLESGTQVICADGAAFEGDLVIAGIGALPNVELARAAGLECDNGIVVDEHARTRDPAVFAAGDCTNHPNFLLGHRLRLETVHNAVEQARTAGATIAGQFQPYVQTPWVWSDQFELRLQSVGLLDGYERCVLRGNPADGHFSTFYFREDEFLGASSVNEPRIFGAARRLLNGQVPLTPSQAADPNFDIGSIAPRRPLPKFDIPWVVRRRGLSAEAWGHM